VGKHINLETGIYPISEWGYACARGFVSDSRFGEGQPVIKRTNRETTRRWRRSGMNDDDKYAGNNSAEEPQLHLRMAG
jgi:hypothetical protein